MNVFRIVRLPDCFTLLNVVSGFCAIMMASQGELQSSMLLIILAVIADGLDGFLARKIGSSLLGPNLDSLADLVSFGAAPAFLALIAFDVPRIAWLAGIFYLVCGILRLARFNISAQNSEFFEGLPIPAAGISLTGSILSGRAALTLLLMILLGALMVSSISYPKIRGTRALSMLGVAFLAAFLLIWQKNNIPNAGDLLIILIILYLVSPVVMSRLRRRK